MSNPGKPESTAAPDRDNAFGFLRLLLAFVVVFDHAYALGGFGEEPLFAWSREQTFFGSVAVDGFFAISGFLVAKSALTNGWLQFLWRRALRIFPGFWAVLCVTAFVSGPGVWLSMHRPLAAYFAHHAEAPLGYVWSNALLRIRTWGILDLFSDTPFGGLFHGSSVNNSLWTLIYEWHCYLLLCVLALSGVLRRARPVVPLFGILLVCAAARWSADPQGISHWLHLSLDTARFTGVFLLGSTAALYQRLKLFDDRLGAASLVLVLATMRFGGFLSLGTPAFVYLLLWLAARLPRVLRAVGSSNDYSYGVYLYGFLVEQCLAQAQVNLWGRAVYFLSAFAASFGCAWLSWHLVEKPALGWKDRGPGRGLAAWLRGAKLTADPPRA